MVKSLGVGLLLIAWLRFSIAQARIMESRDPAGIVSKSVLAEEALKEVQATYPSLPANSTLYLECFSPNQRAATGDGALFRIYYPDTRIVFASEDETSAPPSDQFTYVYCLEGSE